VNRAKDRVYDEDDRFAPLWDSRERDWRSERGPLSDRESSRFPGDDDRWAPATNGRGYLPRGSNRFDSRTSVERPTYDRFATDSDYVGFGSAADDLSLYPPLTGLRPPPAPAAEDIDDSDQKAAEEARKAFLAELDLVAEKMGKVRPLKRYDAVASKLGLLFCYFLAFLTRHLPRF
jgi:hypothetical protein